jgi:hypothetical protein
MSKTSDAQNKTFGSIAALQTIVNSYPKLNLANNIIGSFVTMLPGMLVTTSPIEFILHILRLLGVTREDILNWLATILSPTPLYVNPNETQEQKEKREMDTKANDALLDKIEYAIKGILFLNIKDLFCGCKIEPFIPQWFFDKEEQNSNIGISVPLGVIDMFGMLYNCPVNDKESIYYFDVKPNIFGFNYTPNDVCNSTDFNAFLWHVINKSDSIGNVWDNRNLVKKELLSNIPEEGVEITSYVKDGAADKFFKRSNDNSIRENPSKFRLYDANGNSFYYKPIIKCKYISSAAINEGGSSIKVTIPQQPYTYTAKVGEDSQITFPKTIFEFNFDYIFSLKLFDTKTLVANVLNSLLGLSTTIQINNPLSIQRNIIRGEIRTMIIKLTTVDEDDFNGICATTFSNDDYNRILNDSNKYIKEETLQNTRGENIEKLLSEVKKLEYSSTLDEDLAKLLNTAREIVKPIDIVDYSVNFTFDLSFIYALIEELMVEIIFQILTPKVMMLYYINMCVMNGAVDNFENWGEFGKMFKNPREFLLKFNNLIKSMIKQIIDILIKQLMQFLIEKITPLIKIFAMELLLETIRDYKDLIMLILEKCTIPIPKFNIGSEALQIDNVDYADIVPVLEAPNNDC